MPRTRLFIDSPELYDAIYHFKNYARECDRLRSLINEALPGARTILDVACGTGEHAKFLKHPYAVDGIDINKSYLRAARLKNPSGNYTRADMMDFDLGRPYDVVTFLFSAIDIVRTFERLERAIACMARHVTRGDALIIEPWFTVPTENSKSEEPNRGLPVGAVVSLTCSRSSLRSVLCSFAGFGAGPTLNLKSSRSVINQRIAKSVT